MLSYHADRNRLRGSRHFGAAGCSGTSSERDAAAANKNKGEQARLQEKPAPGDSKPAGPKPEPLWPAGAPGALGDQDADKPTLTPYIVPAGTGTGTAVIVCPGGGYVGLAMDKEGDQITRFLNSLGVTAFVLRYRLGRRYPHPTPMLDVQRAIRLVRARAKEFHLDPHRVGVWGFSAGGHLASTAGTHFDTGNTSASDPIDRVSSRPDFLILGYPVISFTSNIHRGSMRMLLGDQPDPKLASSGHSN